MHARIQWCVCRTSSTSMQHTAELLLANGRSVLFVRVASRCHFSTTLHIPCTAHADVRAFRLQNRLFYNCQCQRLCFYKAVHAVL
jgi:hypothetical protein